MTAPPQQLEQTREHPVANTQHGTAPGPDRPSGQNLGVLVVPREPWSRPLPEACGAETAPLLRPGVVVWPLLALLGGYLSAVAAVHGHSAAAGWLLAFATLTLVIFGWVIVRHGCRAARYRREAPW